MDYKFNAIFKSNNNEIEMNKNTDIKKGSSFVPHFALESSRPLYLLPTFPVARDSLINL